MPRPSRLKVFTALLCLQAIITAACTARLLLPSQYHVSCSSQADCPASSVCVVDVGFCSPLDNPCIAAAGNGYQSGPTGNACAIEGASGVCRDGRCKLSECGDGVVDLSRGEECDEGLLNSALAPDGCRDDCRQAYCGDGVVDRSRGETCDEGASANATSGTCSIACTNTCGDGRLQLGEACDDGNTNHGDGCDGNCTSTACGNGVRTVDEGCDDGNQTNGDGCDNNCRPTQCGNGVITSGEVCDDGNNSNGDGCDANCTLTACGNGIPTSGDQLEECDDGNSVNGDGCDNNCTRTRCGNGVSTPGSGEACDDGDFDDGDGCDANCTVSACGNGRVGGDEQCDDAGLPAVGGDGCSALCEVEAGWACSGLPSVCRSICGDGVITGNEQCDDQDKQSSDGCSSACLVESGFGCSGQPSLCVRTWYIDASRPGGGDGTSWALAFNDVQLASTAISNAATQQPRQEVWVARGIYYTTSNQLLRSASISLAPKTAMYGGFAGNELRREQRDIVANAAILSGDIARDDAGGFAARSDNARHVLVLASADSGSVLDGFTIEGGEADGAGADGRGGAFALSVAHQLPLPTLRHLTFRRNRAAADGAGFGGAIYLEQGNTNQATSPLILRDCMFSDNSASSGGAIYVAGYNGLASGTGLLLLGNRFTDNRSVHAATIGGGAVAVNTTSLIAYNNYFAGNQALSRGGAVAVEHSVANLVGPLLVNNIFNGNIGGGFSLHFAPAADSSGPAATLVWNTAVNDTFSLSSNGPNRLVFGSFFANVMGLGSSITTGPLTNPNASSNVLQAPWPWAGSNNVVGDPLLDSSFVPSAGSPALDRASSGPAAPTVQVFDFCDSDSDGVVLESMAVSATTDLCDLDGDGFTTELLPHDLAGRTRAVDAPGVAGSGADAGAREFSP